MDILIGNSLALMVVAIFVAIVARRFFLPYTVGLVLAGGAIAFSGYGMGIGLTHDIIFDIILPPLLFDAAINIPWHQLRRDMAPILLLSVVGVVISAAVVAMGMAWLLPWPFASALIFGVLIAATDPVAVIAMFKDTGLGGRLRLLVESESLFNDGVAAVLFGLALMWAQGFAGNLLNASWTLLRISGGGIAMGLAAGAIGIFVAGRTREHMVEAAVTGVVAYGAFLAAEAVHVSGILATVSAGLLMGNAGITRAAGRFALSPPGQEFVLELWEFVAFIANSLVFLLIGSALARVRFEQISWRALAIAIVLVLIGRAATVYPLSFVFSRSRWRIGWREQHILWWGGLRGALALALSLSLPPGLPLRDEIVTATFAVVAFSVLVQGLTMASLLRGLGLLSFQKS